MRTPSSLTLSLAIAATIFAPLSAGALSAADYDRLTNIAARVKDGSIEPDVRRIQTDLKTGQFFEQAYAANMRAVRKIAECVTSPTTCKSQAVN